MKSYYKIMLGPKSSHAEECFTGNFIGADYGIHIDLTNQLPDDWREFNHNFIPVFLKDNPGKSKIAAGLACGALWTISKELNIGDIVLCPNGKSKFLVGEIISNYSYHQGQILPHRRSVNWYPVTIPRADVSEGLRNSTNSQGTSSNITKHAVEIETFLSGNKPAPLITVDGTIEDLSVFTFEKHLEDFLVQNWKQSELGKEYDIFEEEGVFGQQFKTDTGPIDILARSKDKKTILVVELKKGRASDNVVGQIQRYMGYIKAELAEENQQVKGVIIALEDDLKIKRALSVTNNIEFYRYEVSFKLFKV